MVLDPRFDSMTYHDLNLSFADLQIVFIVDVHSFQSTFHPIVSPHKKYDRKSTCRRRETSYSVTKKLLDPYFRALSLYFWLLSQHGQSEEGIQQLPSEQQWAHIWAAQHRSFHLLCGYFSEIKGLEGQILN